MDELLKKKTLNYIVEIYLNLISKNLIQIVLFLLVHLKEIKIIKNFLKNWKK